MTKAAEEARTLAVAMNIGACISALLALAFWFDVFGLGMADTQRQLLAGLMAIVSIMEAVLGRVIYRRKMAGK